MGSHILTFSLMMNVLNDHSTCTILYSSIGLLPFFFTDSTPTSGTTITPFSPEFHQYHRGSTYKYDRGLSQQNGYESHPTPPHGTNSSRCLSRNSKRDLRLCGPCCLFHVILGTQAYQWLSKGSWPTTNERDDYVYDYSYSDICLCWSKHHVSSIEFIWDSFRKISYGIAIPTIVIGGVVNAHVAVKYIYVRLDREKKSNTYPNISGPGHMGRNLRCSLAYFMADCRRYTDFQWYTGSCEFCIHQLVFFWITRSFLVILKSTSKYNQYDQKAKNTLIVLIFYWFSLDLPFLWWDCIPLFNPLPEPCGKELAGEGLLVKTILDTNILTCWWEQRFDCWTIIEAITLFGLIE